MGRQENQLKGGRSLSEVLARLAKAVRTVCHSGSAGACCFSLDSSAPAHHGAEGPWRGLVSKEMLGGGKNGPRTSISTVVCQKPDTQHQEQMLATAGPWEQGHS